MVHKMLLDHATPLAHSVEQSLLERFDVDSEPLLEDFLHRNLIQLFVESLVEFNL